jgi:phosphatidylserine decarboxylase
MSRRKATQRKSLEPAPILSAQPGGGFCYRLELAWGRLRRACLRRFCPGYVAEMVRLRQGHCPDCPHDVIDSRDLKFLRPVCGWWFRPEDDPYAWRDRLGLARAGLAELFCFSVLLGPLTGLLFALALLASPVFWVPALIVLLGWLYLFSFFRDPERIIPTDPDALVSPADGTVTHVEEVKDPDFPNRRALRISIFLSVFNVHVNRVPCSGKVVSLRYYPGDFLDARETECLVRNEQFWIDLLDARTGVSIRVKQISGAIARRIVCCLKAGEEVQKGERFGMIKFGSRTDVLVPPDRVREVLVAVGDKVHGGSDVLLRMQ